MTETRYAILIGMDNYNSDPLPYCVKDVNDLEQTLVSHCRFSTDKIHKVIDSNKPVKEQIDEIFSAIEKEFKPNQDLLFFYFSGHGEYDKDEGKSKVLFQDETELTVEDILLRYFLKLTPKNQYLLIDACHSGSNIFFKGTNNPEKEIRRLNYHSSELCLMFATESKKKAVQGNDIQNSYFTYYLTEAIKKQNLYDDDGFLTIQAIDNYIKKKVVEKSDFLQIPVSEIRSSGYKVFSFDEKVIQAKPVMKPTTVKTKSITKKETENTPDEEISFEDGILPTNRKKIQEKYSAFIQNSFDILIGKLNNTELEVVNSNPFNDLEYSDQQKIFKKVIETSRKDGIEAVSGLFEVEQRVERKLNIGGLGSILDHLYEKSKPELEFDYSIKTYSGNMFTVGLSVKAKNIYQVRGGLFALFFQAKYGFAICIVKYNHSWTGTSDKELEFIDVILKPFLLNENNEDIISQYLKANIDNFDKILKSWNEQRQKEINEFKSKTEFKK